MVERWTCDWKIAGFEHRIGKFIWDNFYVSVRCVVLSFRKDIIPWPWINCLKMPAHKNKHFPFWIIDKIPFPYWQWGWKRVLNLTFVNNRINTLYKKKKYDQLLTTYILGFVKPGDIAINSILKKKKKEKKWISLFIFFSDVLSLF